MTRKHNALDGVMWNPIMACSAIEAKKRVTNSVGRGVFGESGGHENREKTGLRESMAEAALFYRAPGTVSIPWRSVLVYILGGTH